MSGNRKQQEHDVRAQMPSPKDARGDQYFAAIGKVPLLEAEEEHALALRWIEQRDRAAFDRLIVSHLRLAAKLARGYRGYGLPAADLASAGTLGLVKAAYGFDPRRGVRFATYAAFWIWAEIKQYVLANWSLVRISQQGTNKRLFFNLRRIKAELGIIEDGELDPAIRRTIACLLAVPEKSVAEMNERLAGGDVSLNAPVPSSSAEWEDLLADHDHAPETIVADKEERDKRMASLRAALARLDDRERRIVAERWLNGRQATFAEISTQYGVSRERIRQIEKRGLEKLRAGVELAA